jgi:hypothetical protein
MVLNRFAGLGRWLDRSLTLFEPTIDDIGTIAPELDRVNTAQAGACPWLGLIG